jgi:hypothetical protein
MVMSPSMAVALIALFIALGGAAYAKQSQTQHVLGAQVITRVAVSQKVKPGAWGIARAICPAGYRAIGGGARHVHDYVSPSDLFQMFEVGPVIDTTSTAEWWDAGAGRLWAAARGWGAHMRNVGETEGQFTVAAVCAHIVVDQ